MKNIKVVTITEGLYYYNNMRGKLRKEKREEKGEIPILCIVCNLNILRYILSNSSSKGFWSLVYYITYETLVV